MAMTQLSIGSAALLADTICSNQRRAHGIGVVTHTFARCCAGPRLSVVPSRFPWARPAWRQAWPAPHAASRRPFAALGHGAAPVRFRTLPAAP